MTTNTTPLSVVINELQIKHKALFRGLLILNYQHAIFQVTFVHEAKLFAQNYMYENNEKLFIVSSLNKTQIKDGTQNNKER